MARKYSIRRWVSILVFVAVVAVSGYAIAASGNMGNPFGVFSQISNLVASGDQEMERGGEMTIDPSASGETRPEPPSGGVQGEGGAGGDSQTTIQWSEFGGVLFNLWFMAAATAVMVIVGPILGSLTKRFRPKRRITPQPAAA